MRPMCMRVYCVSLHPLIQTVGMVTRSTGVRFAQGSLHEACCQGGILSHLLDSVQQEPEASPLLRHNPIRLSVQRWHDTSHVEQK